MFGLRKRVNKVTKTEKKDEGSISNKIEIKGLVLCALSLYMFCALLDLNVGSFGVFLAKVLHYSLGKAAFVLPLYLLVLSAGYAVKHEALIMGRKFFAILLLVVSLIGLLHYTLIPDEQELLPEILPSGGGLLGGLIVLGLKQAVGKAGALIILIGSAVAGLILASKFSLSTSAKKVGEVSKQAALRTAQTASEKFDDAYDKWQAKKDSFYNQAQEEKNSHDYATYTEDNPEDPLQPVLTFPPANIVTVPPEKEAPIETPVATVTEEKVQDIVDQPAKFKYKLPPLNLLNNIKQTAKRGLNEDLRNQSHEIEQTLADFSVKATMVNVTRGPSVTRFELVPAPGVKVSKIQNLADDLALKLAVPSIRIEPVPGKAAIGIEVPSKVTDAVNFRSVVDCDVVRKAAGKLVVGLGKDISGNIITADLAKMPHLLVAGSTGSGKSVCINTIIASLLYRNTPDELKLILVDPKVVELTNYNGIPHLLTPVVTNAKKAASALHWAVVEMEHRYELFAQQQVRGIISYNDIVEEKLPYIVIIIDELADLMMVAPVDVEDAILRLAQKARAAGIHMILATQRPSVDVITGIVKANIPSRIAFAVSSQIDSRTILDMSGAEKLLGKGDMLFYPIGANKPLRVQGAFVEDAELNRIVDYIKAQNIEAETVEAVTTQELKGDKKPFANDDTASNAEVEDELFPDALRLVIATQQASSSMLQRKFRIGYTRAARLVDYMEEKGIVGPADGSKPRALTMSPAQIEDRFLHQE